MVISVIVVVTKNTPSHTDERLRQAQKISLATAIVLGPIKIYTKPLATAQIRYSCTSQDAYVMGLDKIMLYSEAE